MVNIWLTGTLLLSLLIGYLFGSINTSIIVGKALGVDIRKKGSGNAGATNTLRTLGKGAAAIVLVFDFLKAVIAVILAVIISRLIFSGNNDIVTFAKYCAGFGAVLGHNYPLYFGFKGGKGILTSCAVIFMLDWKIGLIVLLLSLAVMAVSKYVSLGSIVGAVTFPVCVIVDSVINPQNTSAAYIVLSVMMGVLAIVKHKANIARLIKGTESKLGQKK